MTILARPNRSDQIGPTKSVRPIWSDHYRHVTLHCNMNNRPCFPFYLPNRVTDSDLPDELSRVEFAPVNLETDVVVFKIFYDYDEICFLIDV